MNSSGLALINSYNDVDDENDSDGDGCRSNSEDSTAALSQSVNRLPLPSTIVHLFKDSKDSGSMPEEDPESHDGRIRSFPHERGNWSTYIYIPYIPEDGFTDLLSRLRACALSVGVELKTVEEPHISLTRTVVLLHHWIEVFVNSVKSKLNYLPEFEVQLGSPAVYCNEERTRTFLGLRVVSGANHVLRASNLLDECLSEFRLPPFYEDPSFHMSVLWVVGDAQRALEAALPQLNAEFDTFISEHPQELTIDVSQCLCKSGNKLFSFPLATC